jgi:hypothetical protein
MCTDGEVVYVNAATCNVNYMPKNLPIVFDVLATRRSNKKLIRYIDFSVSIMFLSQYLICLIYKRSVSCDK